jgi:hypothetical protein
MISLRSSLTRFSKLRLVSGSIVELKYDETESVNEKKYQLMCVGRRTVIRVASRLADLFG